MNTKQFRTKQEIVQQTNPKGKDFVIGIDIGYSGTKVFHENGCFCFPSYAKRMDESLMDIPNEKDIMYRDETTKEVYMVGQNAQNMIDSSNTNDTDGELFSRRRYTDKRFKILYYVALGMATMSKNDNRSIVIQTGLPTSYVDGDTNAIKKAFSTVPKFSLKIGSKPWRTFTLQVSAENVFVMRPTLSLF